MSEQTSGIITGNVIQDEAVDHSEEIAARLATLADYGPIRITTYVTDVPGVRYEKPWRNGPEQKAIGFAGGVALSTIEHGEGLAVTIRSDEHEVATVLLPSQIDSVNVDHPHGYHMPLQGEATMALSRVKSDGVIAFGWPPHVIEYGYNDRIETGVHPEHPAINVVKAYKADDENIMSGGPRKIPSLEEAKEQTTDPMVFLLSRVDDKHFVVTSRMGYNDTVPVVVRRPRHPGTEPLRHVEMIDMHKDTQDAELVKQHLTHLDQFSDGSRSRATMTPFEADALFMYMMSD
jgi:hypothetical protein